MPKPDAAIVLQRLRPSLGERVSDAVGLRGQYGRSEAYREPSLPDLVARPFDAREVREIVGVCHELRLPVVPFGAGTSLEGNAAAVRGGLCLDMSAMDQIVAVHQEDMDVRVGPGIRRKALNSALRDTGLFFPIDPGADASIGGMASTRGSGTMAVRYGTMRDNVLALEVVLPDGTVIRTGGRSVKNVTGYNLRALFCGAEGTLGTITEVTVRLLSKPRYARTAMAIYDRMDDATNTVNAVLASGVLPTSIELIDDTTARCIEDNTPVGLPLDAQAILLFGTDGNDERVVIEDTARIGEIATAGGAREIRIAPNAIEAEKMWSARRAISPSLARRRPNKLGEDIAVPRSAIPEMARRVRAIAAKYALEIPLFGHIGDGNLHPNILCDRRNAEEMVRVTGAAREIFEAAIALGGTLSGEHGIGLLKKQFMELDLGTDTIALMRRIKDAIDPNGIMNPGKVFPDPGGADAFHL